ncbi:hypothetical protein [Demequina aestuarii]|uniref:hypothetical protein n=1 Tax=Demequina aestuarii TaxID=327095 RepID=UPI00078306BA|nr:hypothetical protein [Demequina aestuarii]
MSLSEADAPLFAVSTWDDAIAALALSVEHAENLLDAGEAPEHLPARWSAPRGLGPIPLELVDTARALLARQGIASQRLAAAARDSRQHDRALSQLSQLSQDSPRPPVYIDTPA